jgi:hypothetical protein
MNRGSEGRLGRERWAFEESGQTSELMGQKYMRNMKRKILVILSNRWNKNQKPKLLELDADDKGNILKERALRGRPRPGYDEVWENDEGKTTLAACNRIKRKYRHALEKRKN